MKKRKFIVTGFKPAYGLNANKLIRALDLGTDGAFVEFCDEVILSVLDNATPKQLEQQRDILRTAYEGAGATLVSIKEVTP